MNLDPRNLVGLLKGLSCCLLCGDRWNWKDPHLIQFSPFFSMFPYCQECNLSRSLDAKQAAAVVLISRWMSSGSPDHNGMPWRTVQVAVAKEIERDHGS